MTGEGLAAGHFDVMFRRDLLRGDDERLAAARDRSGAELRSGVAGSAVASGGRCAAQLAAWSLVHGFASLWRAGALEGAQYGGDDPEDLVRHMVAAIEFVGSQKEGT